MKTETNLTALELSVLAAIDATPTGRCRAARSRGLVTYAAVEFAVETVTPTIAQTIFAQLGGQRFGVMVRAKNLCSHGAAPLDNTLGGLSFKIGSGARSGITHVRIFLKTNDTYDVEFLKIRGTACKFVRSSTMVYADQLRAIFTEATGFEVAL